MRSSLRPSALPAVQKKLYPSAKIREVIVPEPEDGSTPEAAYLTAIRKAHRDDCVVLPPGNYRAPKVTKKLFIRAARPGTVRFYGLAKGPAIVMNGAEALWLSGIEIVPQVQGSVAIEQTSGCLILTNCQIRGGIESSGADTSIFLENSRIERTEVGLLLAKGARGELVGTTVSNCTVGISAEATAGLSVLHSRIEGAFRDEEGNPGAGLHAEGTPVYCAGTLFTDNQLGAHFVDCKEVRMLFCEFEDQILGGLMMQGGGPVHLHGCIFAGQTTKTYAHITLDEVVATVDFCTMDDSAEAPVQSHGGNVTRRDEEPRPKDNHRDVLTSLLGQVNQMIGMKESKKELENILHQAHAAIQRRKRGLPIPPLKFHCIFESDEGSGCQQVAALLASSLGALGVLKSGDKFVEAQLDELVRDPSAVAEAVGSAHGGVLFLHAPALIERHDAKLPFAKSREALRNILLACGEETLLIFTGSRDSVRPILRSSAETEELFRATLSFSLPSPPELAEMFDSLAGEMHMRLTSKAKVKILLALHMLDDRRDRRFLTTSGVAKLLDATQKRYFERCSRERNFELPLEAGDIDVPVEKNTEAVLQGHPVFVTICPKCEAENPWTPGQPVQVRCADCEAGWESGWGIWKPAAYYRRLRQDEEALIPIGLPPHRGRAAISG